MPTTAIEGCRQGHRTLLAAISHLSDEQLRAPSRLPDWTVGHVLTHIARNADSVVRRLEGAARGEIVDQYVGGRAGRGAEIEAGAGRSAAAVIADVARTAAEAERAAASMPPDAWGHMTRSVTGEELPAWTVVQSRWREVEIHHVDLGLGYTPLDWPPELIETSLSDEVGRLAQRADGRLLYAWMIGRGPAPELGGWR